MTVLVVMRLADMHRVHPQQDESRVCASCQHRVGIYPSGQAVLKKDPSTEILCSVCAEQDKPMMSVSMLAPGALDEPRQSVNKGTRK